MRQALIALIGFVASCFACALPAAAQICTATVTLNFGTVDMTAGSAIPGQGTVDVSCTGTPGTTVSACPAIAAPRNMLRGSGGQINYELYTDNARNNVWSTTTGNATLPPIDVALGAGGSGAQNNVPIYGLVLAAQTGVPTTNSDTLYAHNPVVTVAAADAAGNPDCAAIGSANANPGTATVTATYQPVCTLAANPLNFGNVTSTNSATDAQTSITATCSAATPYTVWLNGGLTSAANPTQRQMQHGADQLTYGLYQNNQRTAPWGDTPGSNVLGGTGLGSTQPMPVYGRIQASQSTPPAGNYSDTVIVTINY